MERIIESDLEYVVAELNKSLGLPLEPWSPDFGLRYKPNAFNYHLDFAYGKVGLIQHGATGSSTTIVFNMTSRRDLFDKIKALIKGIQIGLEHK